MCRLMQPFSDLPIRFFLLIPEHTEVPKDYVTAHHGTGRKRERRIPMPRAGDAPQHAEPKGSTIWGAVLTVNQTAESGLCRSRAHGLRREGVGLGEQPGKDSLLCSSRSLSCPTPSPCVSPVTGEDSGDKSDTGAVALPAPHLLNKPPQPLAPCHSHSGIYVSFSTECYSWSDHEENSSL